MENETISVTNTDTGDSIDVVLLRKTAAQITVVIGAGTHSVTCDLRPIRSGMAYAGTVMGRELVYQRSREAVQADIDGQNPALKRSRRFNR